eukprot:12937462-Prorocentrum_lima.AAC.1
MCGSAANECTRPTFDSSKPRTANQATKPWIASKDYPGQGLAGEESSSTSKKPSSRNTRGTTRRIR